MTTAGDLIIGGASGTPTRLAAGAAGYALISNGAGLAPSYQALPSGSFNPASPGNLGTTTPAQGWFTDVISKSTPVIDIRSFGAVSGTTDDTTAIENAINSAASGDTIYFPPGTWTISSSMAFTGLPAHLRLLFSPDALLQASSSYTVAAQNAMLEFTNTSDVTVEGTGTIDGRTLADSCIWIQSNSLSSPIKHIDISGINCQNVTGTNYLGGIEVSSRTNMTAGDPALTDVHIDNVRVTNAGSNGIIVTWARSVSITNSYVDNACNTAAQADGGCGGIDASNTSDAEIEHNHVINQPNQPGATNPVASIHAAFSNNISAVGNTITQSGATNNSNSYGQNAAIYFDMCINGVISGNTISEGGIGIRAEVNKNTVVSDNSIQNVTGHGIVANSRNSNVVVNSFDSTTNVTAGTNITLAEDTSDYKEGAGSIDLTAGAAISNATIATINSSSVSSSFAGVPILMLWVKSSAATVPGALSVLAYDGSTQVSTLVIPPLEANTWTRLQLYDQRYGVARWNSGITSLALSGTMASGQVVKLDQALLVVPFDMITVSNNNISRPGMNGVLLSGPISNYKVVGNSVQDPGYSSPQSTRTLYPAGIFLDTSTSTDVMSDITIAENIFSMSPGFATGTDAIGVRMCASGGTGSQITNIRIVSNTYESMAAPVTICSAGISGIVLRDANPPIPYASAMTCTAAIEGAPEDFTDSTTATAGATISGGGTNHIHGRCNGSAWVVD